ncbi:cupin domain-containing protein [Phreatobacter stygius]|uniref:Cupin n=1 Tax=Phreatobacter stygius TaxID=1940610 RepID=A0A4D7B8F3_9HYPH|nr:cupin domain-containing protein [Phreatobacter stygius]QCI64297.1 cupin [Phreatobacter stygius]
MTFTCRTPAEPDVLVDNDKVKVTRWNFADGAETGWHRHGWDYVVVPLADGKLVAELPGGTSSEAVLTAHVPYFRSEGVEHNIINASGKPYAFIEIEIKP